ncbi:hypothetical protein BRD12_04380 [Halobacteriales archaeon SW_12_67_38]|nr:MAG: hypothetical protein BRD12_04380 [Halobacteriales archaeon SW_12_67_38]
MLEPAIGSAPPLDAGAVASGHVSGLEAAGTFTVNSTTAIRGAEGESATEGARVDLGANTAYQVSRPTAEATRYTYAEGATAYQKEVKEAFEEPTYETAELGRPLAESLLADRIVAETIVANGTDSVDTEVLFRDEEITGFSATLVLDPETGVVHQLRTERTTDAFSSGEPVTVVENLRFSNVGSTDVEQPGWVDRLKDGED